MNSTRLAQKLGHVPHKLQAVPGLVLGLASAVVHDPVEVALYVPEYLSARFDYPVGYEIAEQGEARLHAMLGAPWPCPDRHLVDTLWAQIADDLAAQTLSFGRYTYGGFSDGDPALSRAVWCAVRHMSPEVVVETGVARGVTTRFILDALDRNGRGHLWSIDLPHLFEQRIHDETATAVPAACRDRWTYIRGSSRRRLRALLEEVGEIGVFVHDSLHTARNMRFEMDTAWRALSAGGVMIVDDVYNQSFREFVAEASPHNAMVCRSGDGATRATCPSDLCWAFGVIQESSAAEHPEWASPERPIDRRATPPYRTPS